MNSVSVVVRRTGKRGFFSNAVNPLHDKNTLMYFYHAFLSPCFADWSFFVI